jgi:cellulose biosynthesis protein BcsQ
MVKVVAFFNHKGGVGKTTILFNVAIALAQVGKKVILFDADSQANLTALAVTEEQYKIALKYLSSLVPKAQQAHKAIFELNGYEARGAHFKRSKDTRDIFLKLAEIIIERLGNAV